MKKLTTTILLGAALAALGAGSAWAETKVQLLEVITSPARTDFLKSQLAEFEKANPDIKIEVISLPWGQAFEKFLSMVQAGETPDIVEMPERWVGLYGNNGQLEDLGPYMAKWADAATSSSIEHRPFFTFRVVIPPAKTAGTTSRTRSCAV